jgi:glycerol uptake facilitator-like aquaporin
MDFGLLIPVFGPLIGGLMGWLQKKQEIERFKLEMTHELAKMDKEHQYLMAEAEGKILLAKEQHAQQVELAEISALAGSYKADAATYITSISDKMLEKLPWAAKLMVIVDFVRGLIRPVLTIGLDAMSMVILGVIVYLIMQTVGTFSSGLASTIQDELIKAGITPLFPAQYKVLVEHLGLSNYVSLKLLMDLFVETVRAILFLAGTATGWWFQTRAPKWLGQEK